MVYYQPHSSDTIVFHKKNFEQQKCNLAKKVSVLFVVAFEKRKGNIK
jgi:hypothetical protein